MARLIRWGGILLTLGLLSGCVDLQAEREAVQGRFTVTWTAQDGKILGTWDRVSQTWPPGSHQWYGQAVYVLELTTGKEVEFKPAITDRVIVQPH